MKIVFICASLEPGRDGVGDYTRRFAAECIRQGHECRIVAINDRHLTSNDRVEETQMDEGTSILCQRWTASFSWQQRIQKTRAWLQPFRADLASLQFVPFAYQSRGLPWGLAGHLKSLKMPAWHIMFHELCVGLGSSPPFKHRLLGRLQQHVVKRLLRTLDPIQVHTQCIPYQELLQEWAAQPDHLALFSSISRHSSPLASDSNEIQVAYFGSVHSGWDIPSTADTIKNCGLRLGKRIRILAIGSGGPCATATWHQFRQNGVPVEETGPLDINRVSVALSSCRFGLSASCPDLIEKSSAAAAMIAHGLPVLVTRPAIWGDRYLAKVRNQCPWLLLNAEELTSQLQSKPSYRASSIEMVTRQFLNDFITSKSKLS